MNNNNIEQALIELQRSLMEIESARNQVSSVANKSEDLIRSFEKILVMLQSFKTNISIDEAAINNQLNKNFDIFQKGLLKIIATSETNVKGLDKIILNHGETLAQSISKISSDSATNVTQICNDFNSNLDVLLDSINKEINGLSTKLISTNLKLKNFDNSLSELDSRIKLIDFNNDFNIIKSKLNSLSNQNLIISLIIIIMIGIVIFSK